MAVKGSFRILLIDDSDESGSLVKVSLKPYEVSQAYSVAQANQALNDGDYDLILIDVMLPDGDGFKMCNELYSRPKLKMVPKILLTAKTETSDKVFGLNCGADDYITKPFAASELKARVDVKLRSNINREQQNLTVACFEFENEFNRCNILEASGKADLQLTPTEFRIFLTLVRNNGIPLTRHELITHIWKSHGLNIEERGIDTHVAHLRKKLGDLSSVVVSVYGKGYAFKLPEVA
jgi:DNA-binding response OmpR family regulator